MATWSHFILINHHPNPISIKPEPFISPGSNIEVEVQSGPEGTSVTEMMEMPFKREGERKEMRSPSQDTQARCHYILNKTLFKSH